MADHHNLDLSGQTVTQSFAGDTFKGTTNFSNTTFTGNGGNFKGAVFEGIANFTEANFLGKITDFADAVFLAGISFENAKFGKTYPLDFGEWGVRFSKVKNSYFLINKTENKWEEIEIPDHPNFDELLKGLIIEKYKDAITEVFKELLKGFSKVRFNRCRFGAININEFTPEKIKEIIIKESNFIANVHFPKAKQIHQKTLDVFKKHDFTTRSSLSEVEKTGLMRIMARHLEATDLDNRRLEKTDSSVSFKNASFNHQRQISFKNSVFLNSGPVDFSNTSFNDANKVLFYFTIFCNGNIVSFRNANFKICKDISFFGSRFNNNGEVVFRSAKFNNEFCVSFNSVRFSNGKDVLFCSAKFSNGGNVVFNYVMFTNAGSVNFSATKFHNKADVVFSYARFCNSLAVDFSLAIFGNRKNVIFFSSTFSNKRKLVLSQIVWVNGGKLDLFFKEVRETLLIKFDECLFLSEGAISFNEARFPEKGSLMFQRCYFGRTPTVDFTSAFFRHASFEGGEISWLKESPEKILKDRLGEKYDTFLEKADNQLVVNGVTSVFEKGVEVLWKDLTVESAKNLTLRRVNLSHSLFDGMTLSHIQLNAPEWLEDDRRKYLYEDKKIKRRDLNNLRNIEDQYTQLKNNLEKQGNYLHAGYFHYGEQEIRREILSLERHASLYSKLHNLTLRFLSWCYKWCSGYGEKPGLALGITIFIIFLCSSILAIWNASASSFFYKWPMGFIEIITPFSWKGSKSLEKVFGAIVNSPGRIFFLIISQLWLGVQLSMLVLAVRRRFKR